MSKNPIVTGLVGLGYIVLLVSVISFGGPLLHVEKSIFIPIGFLSLFVFSAATMAYVFLYQPLLFLFEGEKKKALDLFAKSLGVFALSALVLVAVGLSFAQ